MKKKQVKKYVDLKDNTVESFMRDHIKLGDHVIVVDGSYMTEEKSDNRVNGIQFKQGGKHELLEVISVNVPRKTSYCSNLEILSRHNNCQIRSNDGTVYNCSLVNIRRFESVNKCECCGQLIH